MAAATEIDDIQPELEALLKCQPAVVHPKSTRLARFLFPLSLHALGIHLPNAAVEFVLVANLTPKTFWGEVEEAFSTTAHKLSILESNAHPRKSLLDLQAPKQFGRSSVARIEIKGGHVILLEYCQTGAALDFLIYSGGLIPAYFEADNNLIARSRYLQKFAATMKPDPDDAISERARGRATRSLRWAEYSGMISERLSLLTHDQVFAALSAVKLLKDEDEHSDADMFTSIWEQFAVMTRQQPPQSGLKAPGSPAEGLQQFRDSFSHFILIQATIWTSGLRPLFMDAFFDVIAIIQDRIQSGDTCGTRAWPYYLTDRSDENGAAYFLIGVFGLNDQNINKHDLDAVTCTSKVDQVAVQRLGKQFNMGRNGEYYVSPLESAAALTAVKRLSKGESTIMAINSGITTQKDAIFSGNPLQTHVAPVRGVLAASLPKPQGDRLVQEPVVDDEAEEVHKEAPASTLFRTEKEAMDQLRWDPKYAVVGTYEVGYVDRFSEELMWLPIEDWEQTTEEEEFIPMHRIRQFRNVATKEVVWDRAMRIDKLK